MVAGALLDLREWLGERLAQAWKSTRGFTLVALAIPLLSLLAISAKIVYEFSTGRYLFLDGHLPGVAVPVAHLVGGLAGVLVLALGQIRIAPGGKSSQQTRPTR